LAIRGGAGGERVVTSRPNVRSNIEVAKLPTFNREASRVSGFLMAYRLYIKIKMRDVIVEEQI